MDNMSISEMLALPLTPLFALVLVGLGVYSITFNVGDARHRNHRRAAKTALAGGWLHVLGGLAIFLYKLLA